MRSLALLAVAAVLALALGRPVGEASAATTEIGAYANALAENGPLPADVASAPEAFDIAGITAPVKEARAAAGKGEKAGDLWGAGTEALWRETQGSRREQGLSFYWDWRGQAWQARRYVGAGAHIIIPDSDRPNFHTHPSGDGEARKRGMFSNGDLLGFLANAAPFALLRDRDGYHMLLRTAATEPGDCALQLLTLVRATARAGAPAGERASSGDDLLDDVLQCASDHGVAYYRGDARTVRRLRPSGTMRAPAVLVGPRPGRGEEEALSWPERVAVQAALKYGDGPPAADVELDGAFGPTTRAAIRAFQARSGAVPTGFLDDAQYLRLLGPLTYASGSFGTRSVLTGGPGVFVWPTGFVEGTFRGSPSEQPMISGHARLVTAEGRVEDGEFTGGRLARGTVRYPDGQVAEGDFAGRSLIRGTIRYPSGQVQEGDFTDNKLVRGRLHQDDGIVIEASWIDKKLNGGVRIVYPNGAVFTGSYDRGRFLKGTIQANGHRYEAVDDGSGPGAGRRLD